MRSTAITLPCVYVLWDSLACFPLQLYGKIYVGNYSKQLKSTFSGSISVSFCLVNLLVWLAGDSSASYLEKIYKLLTDLKHLKRSKNVQTKERLPI